MKQKNEASLLVSKGSISKKVTIDTYLNVSSQISSLLLKSITKQTARSFRSQTHVRFFWLSG